MPNNFSRRGFLAAGGGGIGAVLLAACAGGSSSSATSQSTAAASTPKRGGLLRVGSIGATADTLDPQHVTSDMDQERNQNVYDSLRYLRPSLPYAYDWGLAESIELNAAATVATVKLRSGVEFHNGKSLTADDLIFTMQRMLNPSNPGGAAASFGAVSAKAMKKLDNLTVQFNLSKPDSMFASRWGSAQTSIIPVGFNPAKPVGTGPWKVKSFTPGSRSVMVRNPNYWMSGEPYLDQLEIIDFTDNTSRVAALLSGQIDAVDSVDPTDLTQVPASGYTKMITKSGFYQPITMRVDRAPFNDVRVRQAMRYIVNRPQMIAQAYSGYATVANDMPFPSDPAYPHYPQRVQDIDMAKSLLKAAGHENLAITFTTAAENGGMVAMAQVFAQQASAAGVKVTVNDITPTAFDAGFQSWPFTNNYWAANVMGTGYSGRFLPTSGLNDSHWNDPTATALYEDLLKTTDQAKQNTYASQIFNIFYNEGPDVIHTFKDNIDLFSSKFSGFVPFEANGWSLGSWRYRSVWIS